MPLPKMRLDMSTFKDHKVVKAIKPLLPPLNFITIHYTYFILTCLISSLIFWGLSNPGGSIGYTDSLFLVVSAMTEAGLNTVNLSQMTTAQQVVLWFLIVMGSSIFVSISTVLTRKRVFEKRFKGVVKGLKEGRRERRRSASFGPGVGRNVKGTSDGGFESRHSEPRDPTSTRSDRGEGEGGAGERARRNLEGSDGSGSTVIGSGSESAATRDSTLMENDHGDKPAPESVVSRGRTASPDHISNIRYASPSREGRPRAANANPTSAYKLPHATGLSNRFSQKLDEAEHAIEHELDRAIYPHYLTRATTGRNAQFFGLSKAEREHLGGVEYRAISLLAWVVPIYFVLWQALGCVGLGAYFASNKAELIRANGINPWWLGVFNGVSAFNNSGMSLLDANMIPFQTSVYTLITMGLMILAGNTAYPLFLRLILWTMLKLLTLVYPSPAVHAETKATLRFILLYPRRVYTNLFPSAQTWWLLFMVVSLNGIDWVAFELLNIGNAAVEAIPAHFRVLDGLFQALAVRSGGFYIISIPSLRIGLQVLYVIMMYISVYPVVITMRHSNVYEERSLGIYADEEDKDGEKELPKLGTLRGTFKRTYTSIAAPFSTTPSSPAATRTAFIRQQIHGQLAHDIWLLVLAILIITCIEVSNFERDPVTYSVFNIVFEVVSGYGCVGISTGLPNEAYSFSGGWHKASKVVLCGVMLRGRHRGLPVGLDRAVRLPAEGRLGEKEEEDQVLRRTRSGLSARAGERGVKMV